MAPSERIAEEPMSQSGLLAKGAKVLRGIGNAVLPLITLFTRLAMGYEMFIAGLGKWQHLDATVQTFRDKYHIPVPELSTPFVASLEVIGGIALFLGLGTRFFALLLSINLLVAMLTAHRGQFLDWITYGDTQFLQIQALPYLMLILWILAIGPGRVSIDQVLAKRTGTSPS
jgi:putative oxidoreductase